VAAIREIEGERSREREQDAKRALAGFVAAARGVARRDRAAVPPPGVLRFIGAGRLEEEDQRLARRHHRISLATSRWGPRISYNERVDFTCPGILVYGQRTPAGAVSPAARWARTVGSLFISTLVM
jgi:hypothetical protein